MTDGGFYGLTSKEEVSEVFARLQIAVWMNLIPTPDLEAVDERRRRKNAEAEKALSEGGIVYGPVYYTPSMYLQYELTQFKLDYTVFKGEQVGRYPYREITEEEKRAFYDENRDLFTRYNGDGFGYREVSMIIEKRLREQEYENIIRDLLREL
ncbi:hypothetical protein AALB47_06180 [Lachnospiraceae bacterium 54-11]